MIRAGHCTKCHARIWRGIMDPATTKWQPLFPDPTSQYALVQTEEGLAVGIGYCAGCAPAIGEPGPVGLTVNGRPLGPCTVVRLDAAPERYAYWWSAKYGDWLVAWTRELCVDHKLPEDTFAPILATWRDDREAVALR